MASQRRHGTSNRSPRNLGRVCANSEPCECRASRTGRWHRRCGRASVLPVRVVRLVTGMWPVVEPGVSVVAVHRIRKGCTVPTRDHLSAIESPRAGVEMTIEHPIEDEVTQLAAQVERARGRLAYQFDPALTEVLSQDELHAERDLAERIRDQDRGQRWKEVQASASASDRARQTTEEIEKADMRDLLLARKAIAAQRRESSPHAKLASLYRHRSWSLRALAAVVAAGMLWSAVNVQQNIAPGGVSDPLFWFSYLLEGMISACLIIIMIGTNKVAEWGVIDNRRQVAIAEIALLGLTVSLNTYPYVRTGSWYDAAVHAVAPVMIGVALLIHDAVSSRYGMAIARATEQVRELPDPAEQIRRKLPKVSGHKLSTASDAAQSVSSEEEPAAKSIAQRSGSPSGADKVARTKEANESKDSKPSKESAVKAESKESSRRGAFRSERRPNRTESLSTMTLETDELLVANMAAQSGFEERTDSAADGSAGMAQGGNPAKDSAKNGAPVRSAELGAAEIAPRELPANDAGPSSVDKGDGWTTKPAIPDKRKSGEVKNGSGSKTKEKKSSSNDPDADAGPSADVYNTDQFRVADILEQELAELQAERRRARTRPRSATGV